jgi:hypothetical protein
MPGNWFWIGKYVIVIAAALILGAVLGNLALFKSATLGTPKLTAGALTQFIAHAGALAVLWLLGQRIAAQMRAAGGSVARLAATVLALVTLIVVASAYAVLLQFVTPFLAKDLKPFIDWAFILAILAAAGWLLWALFTDSEAIMEAIGRAAANRRRGGDAT